MSRIAVAAFLLLLLQGCATFKGRTAYMKVVSSPPGADVFVDQRNVGQTPLFAPVPRQRRQEITVRKGSDSIRSQLYSKYRWQESFLANLGWISPVIWPVGWSADLISGAAWDYDPIGTLQLPSERTMRDLKHPVRRVAVAPPLSDFEVLSEEMALEIHRQLQKRLPESKVLPYESTTETFVAFNYTYRGPNDPRFNDELARELGITHLAESRIERAGSVTRAHVKLRDVFSETNEGELQFEVPAHQVSALSASGWREYVLRSISFIPNVLSVQVISTGKSDVEAVDSLNRPYSIENRKRDGFIDQISRVSLRNDLHPKSMRGFKGRFRFIPDFAYSNDKFRLTSPMINGTPGAHVGSYRFQSLHAGVGPELGLETPAGYLYAQLVPVFAQTWIDSSSPARAVSTSHSGISLSTEFGFLFWLSDSFNMRLYIQSRTSRPETWTSHFQQSGINDIIARNVAYTTSGIAIGYYFPEIKSIIRGLLL